MRRPKSTGELAATLFDHVARQADDPLDEVLIRGGRDARAFGDPVEEPSHDATIGFLRRVGVGEHDDVAAPGRMQVVDDLVDEDPVARLERGLHRRRRDEERLDQERLDEQREEERDDDERGELPKEPSGPFPLRRPFFAEGICSEPSSPPRSCVRGLIARGPGGTLLASEGGAGGRAWLGPNGARSPDTPLGIAAVRFDDAANRIPQNLG
jgi:hypothetical protein